MDLLTLAVLVGLLTVPAMVIGLANARDGWAKLKEHFEELLVLGAVFALLLFINWLGWWSIDLLVGRGA